MPHCLRANFICVGQLGELCQGLSLGCCWFDPSTSGCHLPVHCRVGNDSSGLLTEPKTQLLPSHLQAALSGLLQPLGVEEYLASFHLS